MLRYYWFFFALILALGRFAQLCALYMMDTPLGGPLVSNFNRFIWYALYSEIGLVMAVALVFWGISKLVRGKGYTVVKIVSLVLAFLYLALSATNDEIMRWISQRLTLSYIRTYIFAFTDTGLVSTIFAGSAFHFILSALIVVAFMVALILYVKKYDLAEVSRLPFDRKSAGAVTLIFVLAVVGCTSHLWFNPSSRRWDRIRPVAYTLVENVFETLEMSNPGEHYREGIVALGGNPDQKYPFWKEAKNEKTSMESFKAKPMEERPDIIVLTIESLRGWALDMRIEENCKRFRNLCRLANGGVYYPNTHSVGFPSIEGLLGIMQGVYSFPQGIFLNSYPNTKMRSISEILADAGYYTEVLIGSEPNFDNSLIWFQKWFEFYEYKAENENDVALAKRFVELYRERPADKPLFFHWMSRSMHTTFDLPPDMGPKPEDLDEAYLKATAYMDSSLGIILDEVEKGTRAKNTLFVLTGDHSLLNGKQSLLTEKLGQIFDGFTWVSLIFNGPGIDPAVIENPVSQADIAPSLLGYLDIEASNHFMGVDLLGKGKPAVDAFPSVFSFRFGDMAMRQDSLTYLLPQCTVSDSVMVFKSYLKPTWDTSSLVAGYEAGMPFVMDAAKKSEMGRTMQAAAIAWRYVVYSNLLMP